MIGVVKAFGEMNKLVLPGALRQARDVGEVRLGGAEEVRADALQRGAVPGLDDDLALAA